MTVFHLALQPLSIADTDVFDVTFDDALGIYPADDAPIIKNRDGSVASRFRDLSWNMSAYNASGQELYFHFAYWEHNKKKKMHFHANQLAPNRAALVHEIQNLMSLLMFKRPSGPLSLLSLRLTLYSLCSLARMCDKNGKTMNEAFMNASFIAEWMDRTPRAIQQLLGLFGLLLYLGKEQSGYGLDRTIIVRARDQTQEARAGDKQTPPIPTRIYSQIISKLSDELDDWEVVEDRFLGLVKFCTANRLAGRGIRYQVAKARWHGIIRNIGIYELSFRELLREYDLEDYFRTKGLDLDVRGLSNGLRQVQFVAISQVQCFSGMRSGEVMSLTLNAIDYHEAAGKVHCVIRGNTFKDTDAGQGRRTRWVTSPAGHRALRIARKISSVIYQCCGVESEDQKNAHYPLFVTAGYLAFTGSYLPIPTDNKFARGNFSWSKFPSLTNRVVPSIMEMDLEELDHIDPHRAWRSEEAFVVGSQWALSSHQFRRSLALYAQRSGLVSHSSLKRQLQHLTNAMPIFYGSGSAFAKNFIGDDKEHFGIEWQNTFAESSGLAYLALLLSGEAFFGGHGAFLESRKRKNDGVFILDRDEILNRFTKMGLMAYQESPLGGCTSFDPCDKSVTNPLGCVEDGVCQHMVGKASKLEAVIKIQSRRVASFDQETIEYRAEDKVLGSLLRIRDKLQRIQAEVIPDA